MVLFLFFRNQGNSWPFVFQSAEWIQCRCMLLLFGSVFFLFFPLQVEHTKFERSTCMDVKLHSACWFSFVNFLEENGVKFLGSLTKRWSLHVCLCSCFFYIISSRVWHPVTSSERTAWWRKAKGQISERRICRKEWCWKLWRAMVPARNMRGKTKSFHTFPHELQARHWAWICSRALLLLL